jgi:rifampin ADP-ribosylating transferase
MYISHPGLREAAPRGLASPRCRWGRTREVRGVMHDDDWVPVSHDTCGQVAGPFYHGTRADLPLGGLLTAGFASNYHDGVLMNHVYFTTLPKGAGLAAEMARGAGRARVYVVVPTGPFEDDPNVTNRKFRGNPTRSYRTAAPLRIVGELNRWEPYDAEFIRELRRRVAEGMGGIIN